MRTRRFLTRGLLAAALALVAACQQAPITGRKQLVLLSDAQANQMGLQAYQEILSKEGVSNDRQMNAVVTRVGQRIARASGANFDWEFKVINDDSPNAFCLPGGKVGVNTGMFKVAKNEAQLAAVVGHEVAHAVARHGSERISQAMLVQSGVAVAASQAPKYAQVLAAAATLGVVLPFSRKQEAEADEIGLIYMARAGYDPRQAVNLWQNMAAAGGQGPPQFLSTHPAPGNRIENLRAQMPRALSIYNAAKRE